MFPLLAKTSSDPESPQGCKVTVPPYGLVMISPWLVNHGRVSLPRVMLLATRVTPDPLTVPLTPLKPTQPDKSSTIPEKMWVASSMVNRVVRLGLATAAPFLTTISTDPVASI